MNPKLASALTDPLRRRILVELDDRTLSPSQFTREAGGDITQVSRGFRHLERCGYAEVVEERPGKRRGRAVEHVYRRVPNRHSDSWTWPEGARMERAFSSFPAFEGYFARIVDAVEAETFDQEIDRHLSWDIRALDEVARSQVEERLARVLDWLPALEKSAARRRRGATREVMAANAMGNRLRAQILLELLSRPMSPSQFVGGQAETPLTWRGASASSPTGD